MSDGSSFDWMMIDGSTLYESILPKRMRRGMAVSTAAWYAAHGSRMCLVSFS